MTSGTAVLARALCVLAAGLLADAAPALEPEQAAVRGASLFRIQATNAQGRRASGTAVLVAARTFVTNCHVVQGAREIVIFAGSQTHDAHVVRADVERDLCLLAGPESDAPVAMPTDTPRLRPGASIAAAGYSADGTLTWSTGRIEGLYTYRGPGRVIQGSAPFDAGASGGGLFDDRGCLVGILTFKARAGGPFHFAVPVEWVAELLANRPRHSDATSAFWQHTGARQPAFLRAASLAASGDCAALAEVTGQWASHEPDNPEAGLAAKSVQGCLDRTSRTGN